MRRRIAAAQLGGWVAIAPFVLPGGDAASSFFGLAIGLALIALSLPRGKRSDEHYGGWIPTLGAHV